MLLQEQTVIAQEGGPLDTVPQMAAPRPSSDDTCPCWDPLRDDENICYEPVCPEGYFRCCSTCTSSPCYGTAYMELSWRGLVECIKCYPGDYCGGCDTFQECPANTAAN